MQVSQITRSHHSTDEERCTDKPESTCAHRPGITGNPPILGLKQQTYAIDVLKLIARNKLHTTYPREWTICKSHVDQALKLSYDKAKKDGVRCNSWWTPIEAPGRIIIPEDDLQVIMKHQTGASWMSCQANLESLIASGHARLAIGGNPDRTLQQSKLEVIIDHLVHEIKGKDITKDMEVTFSRISWIIAKT